MKTARAIDSNFESVAPDVLEARSPQGKFFGQKRLKKLISHYGGASVDRFCKSTVAAIDLFQDNQRADDITVLMLRRNK